MHMYFQKLVDNNDLVWLNDMNESTTLSSILITKDDMIWNETYECLLKFGDEFGHCNVPLQREYSLLSGGLYPTYPSKYPLLFIMVFDW